VAAQTPAGDDGQTLLRRDRTLVQHRGSAFPGTLVITEARILHRRKTVLPQGLLRALTLGRISVSATITEVMLAQGSRHLGRAAIGSTGFDVRPGRVHPRLIDSALLAVAAHPGPARPTRMAAESPVKPHSGDDGDYRSADDQCESERQFVVL
jgi:hypothetical protein